MNDDLQQKISEIAQKIVILEKRIDVNDQQTKNLVTDLDASIKDLQALLYGSERFRMHGLAERVDQLETITKKIIDDRQSERDKLRGIQLGLGLTGLTGIGTLITLIAQIIQ